MALQLPTFCEIPATPFLMGTPERELSRLAQAYGGTRESYREESPQHRITLPAFAIAQTPVTNALYAAYIAATDARAPIHWRGAQPPVHLRDHPVVDVSWDEATQCCRWLSANTHVGLSTAPIRLPSEAEWEHAARGTDGRTFPWGDAWQPEWANTREAGLGSTTPVGAYPQRASLYGCLDMAGTVWEWTSTRDMLYPYSATDGREDATTAGRRILRGGCYANPHGFARCACRFRLPPSLRNEFLGFRLAYSL